MFERSPRDLAATLTEMEKTSRLRSNFDQIAALEKMKSYLEADRRFDGYAKDKLAQRVMECRRSCAVLDLDDPVLKGQPPRPLDRRTG